MSGTPKHKIPRSGRNANIGKLKQKVNLIKLPSGKRVPAHTVTKDNPVYKGKRFIATKN